MKLVSFRNLFAQLHPRINLHFPYKMSFRSTEECLVLKNADLGRSDTLNPIREAGEGVSVTVEIITWF